MPATLTQVVKQFRQDWTAQLEPDAILTACQDVGYEWRDRCLDPVTTTPLFFVQVVNGNTACTHLRHLTKLDVTAHFGQPGGQQPGCGFPVAHLMALFHAGTGMALKMLSAPLRTHDLSQVVQLHPELRAGDVLVADRGLCSYAHLAILAQEGVHAVLRMHQKHIVDFTPGRPHVEPGKRPPKGQTGLPRSRWVRQLGQHDHVVDWLKPATCPAWMSPEQYAQLPESLEVRELRYRVHQKGFRVESITLVSTLVDAQRYRVED